MRESTIAFVGGGNMARSLIGGLIAGGCNASNIRVSDPSEAQLKSLQRQFDVTTSFSNEEVVTGADAVVMAVKPQVMRQAAAQVAAVIARERALVVSIAAGIRCRALSRWLGDNTALVRAMPNTPALVQSGATALFANALTSSDQKELAESIMRAVGLTVWLETEDHMDVVTALSGSGPAYFFLVMEAMEEAGKKLGLKDDIARLLTLQTALGAARLALESQETTSALRERVTSPGGTTEQGIDVLKKAGLEPLFERAVRAAHTRSEELARALGDDE
jgi:pyrroline-5-carboxylate reductase